MRRPKLEDFTGIIDAILEADRTSDVPRKQRHTAHRIFKRLRDEHGFTGSYTIIKDYVRSQRQSVREAFIPLHHPPGHAQVDFSEAVVEIGGIREKIAFFCLILPHSNVWFAKAYPKEYRSHPSGEPPDQFAVLLGGAERSESEHLARGRKVWRALSDRRQVKSCRMIIFSSGPTPYGLWVSP